QRQADHALYQAQLVGWVQLGVGAGTVPPSGRERRPRGQPTPEVGAGRARRPAGPRSPSSSLERAPFPRPRRDRRLGSSVLRSGFIAGAPGDRASAQPADQRLTALPVATSDLRATYTTSPSVAMSVKALL